MSAPCPPGGRSGRVPALKSALKSQGSWAASVLVRGGHGPQRRQRPASRPPAEGVHGGAWGGGTLFSEVLPHCSPWMTEGAGGGVQCCPRGPACNLRGDPAAGEPSLPGSSREPKPCPACLQLKGEASGWGAGGPPQGESGDAAQRGRGQPWAGEVVPEEERRGWAPGRGWRRRCSPGP